MAGPKNPARVRVTVTGGAEVAAKLRALGKQGPIMMAAALHAGAMLIQDEAQQKAPRKTSTLARSITIVPGKMSGKRAQVLIGPTVEYGKWIEFGTGIYAKGPGGGRKTPWVWRTGDGKFITTRGYRPKPYMRPAFDEKREAALAEFREVLWMLVEANT